MNLYAIFSANPELYYVTAALTGLLIGSFLNVVIYRLPLMMEREWRSDCNHFLGLPDDGTPESSYNLVVPRSSCPHCGHKITAIENIPVLSYLLLRGKCSACHASISRRYPAIEFASCLLTLVIAVRFGVTMQALLAMLLSWSLIVLTMIDYDRQLLPDSITLPFLWLGILSNSYGIFVDIHSSVYGAIAGYLVLWSIYMLFRLVTGKEGMGHGDFKLLAMLGAWLGWQSLPLVIIVSSLLGSVVGLGMILFGNHQRSQPIPFGPYLVGAGLIALLFGNELNRMYYQLLLP